MERITQKDLEILTKRINETTGSPLKAYTQNAPDKAYTANIGNYHLDWAYGGVQLAQISTSGGGIRIVSTTGFGTKRELYNWMQAFMAGLTN